MIKIYDSAIIGSLTLSIIFKTLIESGVFSDIWKKLNTVPVRKEGDKKIADNYRPIYPLPIVGKIFERVLFNSIFKYLNKNNLLSENHSGFRPSDLLEYQLLFSVHDIYASFDCNPLYNVRTMYLDISKAFERVRQDGLIYKTHYKKQ